MSYACSLYAGGGKKSVLEELTVVPSDVEQTHTPSDGYDGFSKVIVQPVPLTTLEVTPLRSWQRFTPESPAIGYSRVDVNGEKYTYNRKNDYPDATSSYELSTTGFAGITSVYGIKNIHISLFDYENQTPAANALVEFHMDLYEVSGKSMCSYCVTYASSLNPKVIKRLGYQDGIAFDVQHAPMWLTLTPLNEVNFTLLIQLSSHLTTSIGGSTRVKFDTSIPYVLDVMWQ